ncbi:MAG: c-type cytochrome [Anaerolineae bacterium]|nr:c-type cytochrome [Anaerolineae bacterium]
MRRAYSAVFNTHDALRTTFLVIGLCLLFTLPAYAQSPDTQPAVSGGRALWSENCAPCHGPAGAGDGPTSQSIENGVPNLLDPEVYRASAPVDHFDIIKNGRIENLMPPWGNRFDDAQIWDLTAYVWSLHTTPDDLVKGAEIYTERCAACHGEGGAGDGVQASADINDLADLQVVSQQSLADWQNGFTEAAVHADIADLSDEELWLALDHIRTFSFAVPQRNGILSGQIINGTTNAPQGDLEVTLYTFSGDAAVEEHTTQADSEGNYRFENLSTDPEAVYVVESRFDDVSYLSQPSPFPDDNNAQSLDLNIYETTTDAESISLSRLNNLVSFTPEAVRIIELFILGNEGDKTYVGQDGSSFTFDLPHNATNVSFQNDLSNRFVEAADGGGYTTNEPIFPGEEGLVIVAVYDLPYDSDTLAVEMPIPADVDSVSMLMELQPNVELVSQQLQFIERRTLQNSEFGTYSTQALTEGDVLTFEISGLDNLTFETPPPSNTPAGSVAAPPSIIDQNVVRWAVLGLGGVAIIMAALLYPRYRPRLVHTTDDDPIRRRQRLLLLLTRLDETYEAGEIDEQVFQQARAEYKAELMRLMKMESGD